MPTCEVCKQPSAECRIRTDDGAYGPVDVQTCRACHERWRAETRAESRRFHMRLKNPAWDRLTTRGFYSEVR